MRAESATYLNPAGKRSIMLKSYSGTPKTLFTVMVNGTKDPRVTLSLAVVLVMAVASSISGSIGMGLLKIWLSPGTLPSLSNRCKW